MRRAFCKIWVSVVGIAVVTSVAGCGGNDAPAAKSASSVAALSASSVAAPSPSSPPVDADAAFAQYLKAVKPFWCGSGFSGFRELIDAGAVGTIKDGVNEYRGVMMTWDDDLGRIAVPPAAQLIVGKLRELNAAEMADMDALVAAAEKNDRNQMMRIAGLLNLDDAMVSLETARLSAALGHPEPQAGLAFAQLEVMNHTFYKDSSPGDDMFQAALSRNDLDGAKAANAIKQDAAQRFIDGLDTIDWPAQFEGQVNVLRENLRRVIEFDRRQVNVDTTAQIVDGPEGPTLVRAVDDAVSSMQDGLNGLRAESAPELAC
jgi:hypothetical protein